MPNHDLIDAPATWPELWTLVGDSLLSGVHHALNNRVAAISAITQVLETGMPDTEPLLATLMGEVDRLERAVGLIALLRRARSRTPEPIQVPELLSELPPLVAQHSELRETTFAAESDPGILPVWAERDLLTRVLLTLLVAAGLEAERAGRRRVRIRYRGDDRRVVVEIGAGAGAGAERPGNLLVRRLDPEALAEVLHGMEATLEVFGGGEHARGYRLSLPTMLAAPQDPLL